MSNPEDIHPTELSPLTKKVIKRIKARITIPIDQENPNHPHAIIESKPGEDPEIFLKVPYDMVSKRLPKGERIAYFFIQISNTVGAVEISERIPSW